MGLVLIYSISATPSSSSSELNEASDGQICGVWGRRWVFLSHLFPPKSSQQDPRSSFSTGCPGQLAGPVGSIVPIYTPRFKPRCFPSPPAFSSHCSPAAPRITPGPSPISSPRDAALLTSGASLRACCFLLPFQFGLFLRCGAQTGAALSLGWSSRASLQMRFRKAVWESFCTAHPQKRAANPSLV